MQQQANVLIKSIKHIRVRYIGSTCSPCVMTGKGTPWADKTKQLCCKSMCGNWDGNSAATVIIPSSRDRAKFLTGIKKILKG